jgi:hypothetical protein
MWGSTVTLTAARGIAPLPGGIHAVSAIRQVVRVNYRRPETWSFWVASEVLGGNVSDVQMDVHVDLNLMTGVGRTLFDTGTLGLTQDVPAGYPTFIPWIRFVHSVPAGIAPGSQGDLTRKKWTTVANSPVMSDLVATSSRLIDTITGQDLQVGAQIGLGLAAASAVANSVTVGVTCYLAPQAHVRPDWMAVGPPQLKFLGGETGGT